MENNEEHNKDDYPYYSSNRFTDFTFGCLGVIGYILIASILISNINLLTSVWWLFPILYVAAVIFFFYKRRPYVSLGMIAIVFVPLLVGGGCLALFGGLG